MKTRYWFALVAAVWFAPFPAWCVQAAQTQGVTSSAQQDWYQGRDSAQARAELEQQLQEVALARLHPEFLRLWRQLHTTPVDVRSPLYDEVFAKLARFQQAWRAMGLVAREQMKTVKIDLAKPLMSDVQGTDLLAQLVALRPQVAEYEAVRAKVKNLLSMPMASTWPTLTLPTLRPGDTHPELGLIRTMLNELGDGAPTDDDPRYDADTELAVKAFQRRHGLTVDGIIGRQTRSWLNTGPKVRASLLLRNLWRRDVVEQLATPRYVLVNIPDYRLSVVNAGSEVFVSRVIVGKEQRATPILASEIRSIVLNPPWHVPRSILNNDILPRLARDPGYLGREQFEVIDGSGNTMQFSDDGWHQALAAGFPYRLRQKPGDHNALGRYKFDLPNNDAIYLHSTPRKSLFEKGARAFSSGCIRVERADELATLLLADSRYQPDKVTAILTQGNTKWLSLLTPVPVFTVYWSSWLDEEGQQQLRNDIYGFDHPSVSASLL
ncbi:L,D-transpeptidase family protein [Aeromonas cavernicola]|uniref:Murein L,D-transpeptidase n=1 Tax=Aeromonas cavernicola TaxID=1006623 RepID=A0A2H9U673_9GAMM|nr:L,D-transpeptidase family protein [Aeromonas cavernicola]PJG59502.1 murein L,D-transpeptidase [Aeromonas cavernicola]